jgi:hypothetical protein
MNRTDEYSTQCARRSRVIHAGVATAIAILALTVLWAGSVKSNNSKRIDRYRQARSRTIEYSRRLQMPGAPPQVAASARSSSVLNDTRRPALGLEAWAGTSPGIEICSGTSYDLQHNDDGQKQIATLGGGSLVHFVWTHWDVIPTSVDYVDRYVNYNAYSPATGITLGDCGAEISGAGGSAEFARGAYATIAVGSDDNAHPSFHQRDTLNQPLSSDRISSSFVLDQTTPGADAFIDNELPGSVDAGAIWPHIAIDQGGSTTKTPGDDVYHVCSRAEGYPIPANDELYYWRRIGASGTWEGPVILDRSPHMNHHVATDPASEDVAIIYTQNQTPGNPGELTQVVYLESATNGADWIAAGVPGFPTPLTDLGFPFTQVTYYSDSHGPQSWRECCGEYDLDGRLHVVWVEQAVANQSAECRIQHWDDVSQSVSTIAEALDFVNTGSHGYRDLWLAYPQIGFGDGSTLCNGGPPNPGVGGATSNRDYVYVTYEQAGGPTAAEGNDVSYDGYQNLELYLTVSNNHGVTWTRPANLTNTKTPGCDGYWPDTPCASERDASIALTVSDTIHLFYLLDIDPGDAWFGQGEYTINPVMYYRIPGGTDAEYVCPPQEPRMVPLLSNSDPDCEYHATFDPPGAVVEQLSIYNYGVFDLTGTVSVQPPSATWLQTTEGAFTVTPGGAPDVRTVTMDASDVSITGEGLYTAQIEITHNDPNLTNPFVVPVDFFVFDEFYCPAFLTLNTGCLWLEVSNVERVGNQNAELGGLARLADDSSWSVYDASLLIGVPPNPDTLVYRNIYGEGNGQNGFRALSNLEIDTSAYGTNTGEATAFANQTTVDSTLGIDVQYVFPQNPDSCEFVLIKYRITNRTESDVPNLVIGEAVDFDVMPGVDERVLQPDVQNTGELKVAYNMVYQQGVDTTGHVVIGDHTATRFKAGITSLQCDQARRAWIAPNDPWLTERPGGGFHEGYLYQEMTKTGFELFPPNNPDPAEDLHAVMVAAQDVDLAPGESEYYQFGLVSSNTGTDDADLINTTRKAWRYAFGWSDVASYVEMDVNASMSWPYYAIGTHEDGLAGGCCGCIVDKVGGSDKLSIVPGSDPCRGTIEFSGDGSICCSYSATFRLTDLCETYEDIITVTIQDNKWCECECPFQGDYDTDGFITALDLGSLIDVLFGGDPEIHDFPCPTSRGDWDCDCFATALDLSGMIDYLFNSGGGPCLPCEEAWDCYSNCL